MKIKVRDLLPNPFRNIDTYPINQEKIRELRNSIRETTFWDNILARPAPSNGKYQIAYGHHRLTAIKEELGKDTVVDIPVRDLSDEDMLRIMANENMDEWTNDWQITLETINQTRKFLKEHREIIQKMGFGDSPMVGAPVISKFLGANWPERRISQALAILKDTDIKLISVIASEKEKKKKIDISTLEAATLIRDKQKKNYWLEKMIDKDVSLHEVREIARFENEPILSEHDKQIVRENILEGRIRGKEQIREQVDFIKVRKLQEAKKTDEQKRREELKDFINRSNELAVGLNNKLEVLVEQFQQHPGTKKYLPQEETIKFSRSLTTLFVTIKELIDITRSRKKEERKELVR